MKPCVCFPRVEPLFSSVLWSSGTQGPLAFNTNALGAPIPNSKPQVLGTCHGFLNFHSFVSASVIQLFFIFWVTHLTSMGLLKSGKFPSCCLIVSSSFSLGIGYLFFFFFFFDSFQSILLMVFLAVSCYFGVFIRVGELNYHLVSNQAQVYIYVNI